MQAERREPDGSWVQVSGYGRFAVDTTVDSLLAATRPQANASPVHLELAPAGWQMAAFKDVGPTAGVVTLTPPGGDPSNPGGPDAITVIRYPTTATDFPAQMQGQGPTSTMTSNGRSGILVRGTDFWALQLQLPAGGSLVLLLPTRVTRDQVEQFADGVFAPTS